MNTKNVSKKVLYDNNLLPNAFVVFDQRSENKRSCKAGFDLKSENIGLPAELRLPSFQMHD